MDYFRNDVLLGGEAVQELELLSVELARDPLGGRGEIHMGLAAALPATEAMQLDVFVAIRFDTMGTLPSTQHAGLGIGMGTQAVGDVPVVSWSEDAIERPVQYIYDSAEDVSYPIWVGPAWLRLYQQDGSLIGELWEDSSFQSDPVLSDRMTLDDRTSFYAGLTGRGGIGGIDQPSDGGALFIGEWRYQVRASTGPPYPNDMLAGNAHAGIGATGTISVSR